MKIALLSFATVGLGYFYFPSLEPYLLAWSLLDPTLFTSQFTVFYESLIGH